LVGDVISVLSRANQVAFFFVRAKNFAQWKTGLTLTLVHGRSFLGRTFDVFGEPFVKLVMGIKQCWHDEMQQGPELK
jgi:hypothetical protein